MVSGGNDWWGGNMQQGGGGVIFLSTSESHHGPGGSSDEHEGQFYLWSPLMKFSLAMAIIVGVLLIIFVLYALFYFCMYGTCCWQGSGWCFWGPGPAAVPPCDDDEPVKVRIRRPSRSDSCRSSMRSTRSDCSCQSTYAEPQPIIIQTIPAAQPAPQVIQAPPQIIQAPPQVIQAPPQIIQAPPLQVIQSPPQIIQAPPQIYQASSTYGYGGGNSGAQELRLVIGDSRPQNNSSGSGNVIVYDMGRSNAGYNDDF